MNHVIEINQNPTTCNAAYIIFYIVQLHLF